MLEENATLQPHLGTGSVPVSSGLHADLSGCTASYHLYLQNPFLRKDPGDFDCKGKWWRHSSMLLKNAVCTGGWWGIRDVREDTWFFPCVFQYVLADRVNSPSRFTPLKAALNPLLPGKSKACVQVGNLNFSSRKSKRKEKINMQLSTCRRLASVFLLAVCGRNQGLFKSSRWVV